MALTGRFLHHTARTRVIKIEHALFTAVKEHCLGFAVFLHRLVKIKMILRQIRERTDGKADTVNAVQPASRICASSPCRAKLSGVVRSVSSV